MPFQNKYKMDSRKAAVMSIAKHLVNVSQVTADLNGNLYQYNGQFWSPIKDRRLEEMAMRHLFNTQIENTAIACKEIVLLVRDLSRQRLEQTLQLMGEKQVPWSKRLQEYEIPFHNGVLDVRTDTLREHHPSDFLESVWPISYNPQATCPRWEAYLHDCFGNYEDGNEYIAVIEEFLGYTLIQKAPFKKALFCFGESNTGKTVFEHVMTYLVGKANVCHIPIDRMNDQRATSAIKGKALNLMSELKFDTILSDSGFKRLVSTGEPLQIDAKYRAPETYEPFCKHVVFTNAKPKILDNSDAVFNRLILLEFRNVIEPDRQDPYLPRALEEEIEGIALKAIGGLKRLLSNKGRFTQPQTSQMAIRDYKREQNPAFTFVEEYLTLCPQNKIPIREVWEVFKRYYPKLSSDPKRITSLLKEAGCDIRKTSSRAKKQTYLIGYIFSDKHLNKNPDSDEEPDY